MSYGRKSDSVLFMLIMLFMLLALYTASWIFRGQDYSYVRALRDRGIKRSGPDLGARAAKRRDRPRGGPAAGPDERVSPSLHLARATMKHTSAAQQRSTVWFSLSVLEVKSMVKPVPICCQPVLKTPVLRGNLAPLTQNWKLLERRAKRRGRPPQGG